MSRCEKGSYKQLATYKREVLRAARELKYSSEIQEAISNAVNETDVIRAMIRGRRALGERTSH